jgi:hypothetical protein
MKSIVAVLTTVFLLGACTVSGPKVKIDPGEVKVKPVEVEIGGGSNHCPPGHAKKNWC